MTRSAVTAGASRKRAEQVDLGKELEEVAGPYRRGFHEVLVGVSGESRAHEDVQHVVDVQFGVRNGHAGCPAERSGEVRVTAVMVVVATQRLLCIRVAPGANHVVHPTTVFVPAVPVEGVVAYRRHRPKAREGAPEPVTGREVSGVKLPGFPAEETFLKVPRVPQVEISDLGGIGANDAKEVSGIDTKGRGVSWVRSNGVDLGQSAPSLLEPLDVEVGELVDRIGHHQRHGFAGVAVTRLSRHERSLADCRMREGVVFDQGRFPRAKIGFVELATEQTIESDMMRLAPAGVGIHFTRSAIPDQITAANLGAMIDGLGDAAAILAPNADLDVICYACTSGSVVMGEDEVKTELRRGAPNAIATTLISGVLQALETLNVGRVAVATPYLDEVNQIEAAYMSKRGFDVVNIEGLNITNDSDMVRVTPSYIADFAVSVDRPEAEAIFVSCGALRTVDVIDEIETRTGKPCVASNQAMLWHCLRLAGITDQQDGLGTLLREH